MASSLASRVLLPGFVGTELPSWLATRLRNGLAGVCVFGGNISSREQLRELTAAIYDANPDALIAIDEEGGDVTRLYFDVGSPYPGNAILGRIDDLALTESVAATVGWQLRRSGVNLNFAPDVDINSNPDNPVIGVRSFGTDPALVARHSAAWTRGLQSTAVAVSAKHFPGHGDTAQDSHLALPVVDSPLPALRERELVPFVASIAAGAKTIMTSHILLPQLDAENPATFSRGILQGLLRDDLGFTGVIVSDALDMVGASGELGIPEAAVRAIAAGCDLLCIGTNNTDDELESIERALDAAVAAGRLHGERLTEAGDRNVALARELAAAASARPIEGPDAEPEFDLALTSSAFDVASAVVVEAERTLVSVETVANIAVGTAPWGPPVAFRISEGGSLPEVPGQLVIVGKDNHRHGWVRDLIEGARTAHPSVIVVDMGWPGDDRAYADIATFGASKHVSRALVAWLEGATRVRVSE